MITENKVTFIDVDTEFSIPVLKDGDKIGFQVYAGSSRPHYQVWYACGKRENLAKSPHVLDGAVLALPDEMKLGFCEDGVVYLLPCHAVDKTVPAPAPPRLAKVSVFKRCWRWLRWYFGLR